MDRKTAFIILLIFGITAIALGSFYQRFVVEMWGDIFHIPYYVWIPWIFWLLLGMFLFLVLAVILFLFIAFRTNGEIKQEPTKRKRSNKNKRENHAHAKPKAKRKTQKEPPGTQVKTVFVNGKNGEKEVPEHPAEWNEREYE